MGFGAIPGYLCGIPVWVPAKEGKDSVEVTSCSKPHGK